jgi:hypothetical protein
MACPQFLGAQSGVWKKRITRSEFLDGGVLVANPENARHCFFGERYQSRLFVMRIEPIKLDAAEEEEEVG